MNDPQIAQYLNRIKLNDCHADLDSLIKLQEHHMMHIPFENLDIVVGREIALDHDHLYEKMIMNNRGGYCFELNTLYANLLSALGFNPKPVLGRVWMSNPKGLPPRNHFAQLVEVDGKTYITDVGFAGLITRMPLDINDPAPVDDKDGMIRVVPIADRQFMIQRQIETGWANQYSFEDVEISDGDINIANYYMSTHAHSHLIKHKCVGKITADGRLGLFNNKMTTRKGIKVVAKQGIDYGGKWIELIQKEFSITLDFSDKEIKDLFRK